MAAGPRGTHGCEEAQAGHQGEAAAVQAKLLQLGRAAQPVACGGGGTQREAVGRGLPRHAAAVALRGQPVLHCSTTRNQHSSVQGGQPVHLPGTTMGQSTPGTKAGNACCGACGQYGELPSSFPAGLPSSFPAGLPGRFPAGLPRQCPAAVAQQQVGRPSPPAAASPSQRIVSARSEGSRGCTAATSSTQ